MAVLTLILDEMRAGMPIHHGRCHGVGQVSNAAQTGHGKDKFRRRNINTHAADQQGNVALPPQQQGKVKKLLDTRLLP